MREFKVRVNGEEYQVQVEEIFTGEKKTVATGAQSGNPGPATAAKNNVAAKAGGPGRVLAPLPGTVIKVLVAPGDRVEAGQLLLLLEAMKMQNEILSPAAGIVAQVAIKAGEQVGKDALLVEIG